MAKWNTYVRKWISKVKPDPYKGMSVEERFNTIYKDNDWKDAESVSGPGSNKAQTKEVIRIIESVIESRSVKTIVDIPCGDFGWMQDVELQGSRYLGGDIVEALILENQKTFQNHEDVSFAHIDLLVGPIPDADLLIVRDCLVHLSNDQVQMALENIYASNVKFLLTTTFTNRSFNADIHAGDWRPLNLELPPFSLSEPELVFNEKCTENEGRYADKSLGLWSIKK